MSINFSGVYTVPRPLGDVNIPRSYEHTKLKNHLASGGKQYLLLDDKNGQDATEFTTKLEKSDKWAHLVFEPRGVFNVVWNMVVETLFDPLGKREKVENEMAEKAQAFNS